MFMCTSTCFIVLLFRFMIGKKVICFIRKNVLFRFVRIKHYIPNFLQMFNLARSLFSILLMISWDLPLASNEVSSRVFFD